MKVAIVLPSGSQFSKARPNSMETVVRTMAHGASSSTELRIFCCEGAEDHGDFAVQTLPSAGQPRWEALAQALRDFAPDVVEFHQQAIQAAKMAGRAHRAPSVLYRHNALKTPRNPLDRWRHQTRYARMDGLIFVSESEKQIFLRDFPSLHAYAHAIPNPIDAELWRGDVDDRDPVLAFAGRAMPEKGVDLICAALPGVLDRHPEWKAVLMLNDWAQHSAWAAPHVAPLERFGERVQILKSAPLAEVRAVMQRAAIALTPSVWAEPLGLTALEAHAAGAALISSGRGGLREASGPHALYLDEVSASGLARAMNEFVENPVKRQAMALGGQKHVFEAHTPTQRAAELADLRARLIASRRRLAA